MITREQLETAIGEDYEHKSFTNKGIDHDLTVINLLRQRIPFEKEQSIIQGANHDVVYLIDIDIACEYLLQEDLAVLQECNVIFDEESDCLSLFV